MRLFITSLLFLLVLSACNNRENPLLPPDLANTYYLKDSTISATTNYLIACSNDDAYLYIPSTSIADSLLLPGDRVVFEARESFFSRDSLAFGSNSNPLGNTYYFGIIRDGNSIQLSSIGLARIFCDLAPSSNGYLLGFDSYLYAVQEIPEYKSPSRAWYYIGSTGEYAMAELSPETIPSLQIDNNSISHALIQTASRQYAMNFPAEYCMAAGRIDISVPMKLSANDTSTIQDIFPNIATSAPPLVIKTANDTGKILAYLQINERGNTTKRNTKRPVWTENKHSFANGTAPGNLANGTFTAPGNFANGTFTVPGSQAKLWNSLWLRINGGKISTWESTTGENTNWSSSENYIYTFLLGSGSYFFANPLPAQNSLSIYLDGRYSQIYLPNLWLDLSNAILSDYTVTLDLQPSYQNTMANYFSGNPYQSNGNLYANSFTFYQNSSPVKALPDGYYLEYGFVSDINKKNTAKLFSIYQSSAEDIITFKTQANSYDAEHFTATDNWIYSSVAISGLVLYGNFTQNNPYQIPYLKASQYLQGDWGYVYWNDETKHRSFTKLVLNTNPTGGMNHPWLQGEPLSLSQINQLAEYQFYIGNSTVETVPANFVLKLPADNTPNDILLLSPSNKLSLYNKAEGNYIYSNNVIEIAPAYCGKLISAQYSFPNPAQVRIFPNMAFLMPEMYLYTSGNSTNSTTLTISRSNNLSDPYQLLTSQYNFSPTSLAYQLNASTDSFYTDFSPTLYFPKTRGNEFVVYENTEDFYRFYPYSSASTPDPWHFWTDNNFIGVYPAYDGKYALFTDNNPHQSIIGILNNNTRDMVVSLYQAQFVMPQFYINNPIPLNSRITLNKLSTLSGTSNLLSAYQLLISGPAGAPLTPNFFNIPTSGIEPYIYIPIDNTNAISTARMFYRSVTGINQELIRVNAFSTTNWMNEYIVKGNSFICNVNNPGWYYVTE